jgi:YidC/Oxa1 family membrane protein insertase
MDSGRFLLAIVLMIAVMVITNVLLPPPRPAENPLAGVDSASTSAAPATVAPTAPAPAAVSPTVVDPTKTGAAAATGIADTATVTSPVYRYGISSRGGALVSAELLEYESFAPGTEGEHVQLNPAGNPGLIRHRIRLGSEIIDLSALEFTFDHREVTLTEGGGPKQLSLTHRDSLGGRVITITYTFQPDLFVFDVEGRVSGASTTPQILIDMGPTLASNEAVSTEDDRALAYVINSDLVGIQSQLLGKLRAERIDNGPLAWIALKNKYFLIAAMQSADQPTPFGGVIAQPTGLPNSANLSATLLADGEGRFVYRLYVGPRESDHLTALGNQLQDVSVFGWRFLQPVLRPLGHAITWAVLQLHSVLGLGYGWVLILFGFLIRFVLWPLNSKAMRSQLKNMEIQPRIKDLQTRYKSDPQKLQQEMLKLYKEEGFNPMGGCLPMLLPLPVLITLFFVFQSTIEFRGVPFLWLPDLARKDPLYILPVALGISMFIQQWLNMRTTKDAPAQMKYMTYFMPIFMTFLFLNFASGLNLYYASMNLASVPQQLQIMKEKQRRMTGGKPKT